MSTVVVTARHGVHPNQVSTWKRQAMEGLSEVFSGGRAPAEAYRGDTPVDMMDKPLRALTTYLQAQQQQQEERFKGIMAA